MIDWWFASGTNELWVACFLNRTEQALLLAEHEDVNQDDHYCMTPLYWAVKHGNLALVKKLLSREASDHAALYVALELGNAEIIHRLLNRGMYCKNMIPACPGIRAKLETIELFKTAAELQRPDLLAAHWRAGRAAPFRQWLHLFNEEAQVQIFAFLVLAQRIEASCFAAFFFGESDAPIRRYTWTGSPVSELLVRYLVLPKAGRRALRDIRAYLE